MAVEVQSGVRIYTETDDETKEELEKTSAQTDQKPPPLRHNFQHDLESVFWILSWLAITHVSTPHPKGDAERLFHSKDPDFESHRRHALRSKAFLRERLTCLGSDHPKLKGGLLWLRQKLHEQYMERKLDYHKLSTYAPLYHEFRDVLQGIAHAAPPGTVRLERPQRPKTTVESRFGGSHSRTLHLQAKQNNPEGVRLSPHKETSLKRVRGSSEDTGAVDDTRPEKRHAQG